MSSKISKFIFMQLLILLIFANTSIYAIEDNDKVKQNDFKVIAYYTATSFDEPLERLQLDKLTHVMYGFARPTKDGDLIPVDKTEKLKELVELAHQKNVKVFIAIGGWSYQNVPLATTFAAMSENEEARQKFVDNVVEFVTTYNLDGAEIDWEYPQKDTGEAYEALIVSLSEALHAKGKELSAAVAGAVTIYDRPETSRMISEKAHKALDFIQIMAYDLPLKEHSPLWYSQQSIAYWIKQGVPSEKIILGMPLYARPSWVQYRHLVEANPEYAFQNFVEAGIVSKLDSSYNGLPLLHDKTVMAIHKKAGGIMFFDINEDTEDEYSALSMVDRLLHTRKKVSQNYFESLAWVYINNHPLEFSFEEDLGIPHIDENGRTIIPLRKSIEYIGGSVDYQPKGQVITIKKDENTIVLSINSSTVYINNTPVEMDTKAVLINNRTYIPTRVVFEALGYQVKWQSAGRSVYISK